MGVCVGIGVGLGVCVGVCVGIGVGVGVLGEGRGSARGAGSRHIIIPILLYIPVLHFVDTTLLQHAESRLVAPMISTPSQPGPTQENNYNSFLIVSWVKTSTIERVNRNTKEPSIYF